MCVCLFVHLPIRLSVSISRHSFPPSSSPRLLIHFLHSSLHNVVRVDRNSLNLPRLVLNTNNKVYNISRKIRWKTAVLPWSMGELIVPQPSSYPLEHKAPTNLQSARSWVSQLSSIQVFPAIFIFSSTVLLRVPSGQSLFLGGVHFRAACRWLFLPMGITWRIRPLSVDDIVKPC